MSKLIDTTPSLLASANAESLAADLTANDGEGWTYRAQHAPGGKGKSKIVVYDEENEFVGYF